MTSSAIGAATPRLRGALSYDERAALMFVAPLAAVLLAVAVFPILYSFYVSLFSLKLTRPGSIVIVDNVVRQGAVADPNSRDAAVKGVHRLVERIAGEKRVTSTAIQTVGVKGYDGFTISVVT